MPKIQIRLDGDEILANTIRLGILVQGPKGHFLYSLWGDVMSRRVGLCLAALLLHLAGSADVGVQAQEASTNSFQFRQPVRVTLRMANNSVIQSTLVGIDENGISVMSQQGKRIEYANKAFKTLRSADGSIFYTPAKDSATDLIERLNQLQPATPAGTGPGGIPGQPGIPGSSVPFTVTGAQPQTQPGSAHSQPGATNPFGGNNAGNPGNNPAAQMMAHAQANMNSRPGSGFPNTPPPNMSHSQSPNNMQPNMQPNMPNMQPNMPMGGNMNPPSMPNMQHNMPNMQNNMAGAPGQATMWEYECSKCRHRFTSATEIQAGHRCAKCGVVWGQVQDQNGNVTSRTPASVIGTGIGVVVVVIGIISAIARKSQAA